MTIKFFIVYLLSLDIIITHNPTGNIDVTTIYRKKTQEKL